MNIPIWLYDYKQKRYVVFPHHLLETFEDGRKGISNFRIDKVRYDLLMRYPHLFKMEYGQRESGSTLLGINVLFEKTRHIFTPILRQTKDPKTGAKWYSKDQSQIKSFKRKRK